MYAKNDKKEYTESNKIRIPKSIAFICSWFVSISLIGKKNCTKELSFCRYRERRDNMGGRREVEE
jgi:hypothetical protein